MDISAFGLANGLRAPTGIAGLDTISGGGVTQSRLYLVEGTPGNGKTTLALPFLLEGARRGEPGLYITLSETEAELRAAAATHGWAFDGRSCSSLFPRTASVRSKSKRCCTRPRWNWAKPSAA